MVLSDEDKILLTNLYQSTAYKAMELSNEFLNRKIIRYNIHLSQNSTHCLLDDKHSDHQPERDRHVRIFLHADSRCYRGGRYWHVTCQRLRPVRLSNLAHWRPGLDFSDHVDIRNSHHCTGALYRCRTSSVLQRKNEYDHFL